GGLGAGRTSERQRPDRIPAEAGGADAQRRGEPTRITADKSTGFPGTPRELSGIHAVETNPHPDPLPFRKGEGNLRWHRVRVTEQGSEKGAFQLSYPRSEGERIKVRGASDCILTAEVLRIARNAARLSLLSR